MCTTALFMRESCGQSGDTPVNFSTLQARIAEIPRILACGQDSFSDHLSPGSPMALHLSWGNTSLDMTPEAVPKRVIHRSHVVVHRRVPQSGDPRSTVLPRSPGRRKPYLKRPLGRGHRRYGLRPLRDCSGNRCQIVRVSGCSEDALQAKTGCGSWWKPESWKISGECAESWVSTP